MGRATVPPVSTTGNTVQKDLVMASVNTNFSALVALQNLTKTTGELEMVQNRINTGLKVASAKDNGAVYAIAQAQRSRVASIASIADGIDRTTNVIDTGLSAGETISDLLTQMKEKAVAAQAGDLSTEQRAAVAADFNELRNQVTRIANSATFNGANVVNGLSLASGSNPLRVLLSDVGGSVGTGNVQTETGAAAPSTVPAPSRNAEVVDASEAYDATNNTLAANDFVRIAVTSGSNTTTFALQITATTTIASFVNSVGTATGGSVIATYDETTGQITYQGQNDTDTFAITVNSAADGSGTARRSDFVNGVAGTTASASASAADTRPSTTTTITTFDFTVGGTGALNGAAAWDVGTSAATAGVAATAIDAAITTLNSNLASLGSQSKALATQKEFLGKLSSAVEKGIGQLVDADLARESARLQSLQVKQQLGAQALSIANSAPSIVLSFFR
jgi:flagellin